MAASAARMRRSTSDALDPRRPATVRRWCATIRDFTPTTHADFEPLTDSDFAYPGLVRAMLGGDGKPVYAPSGPTPHTAGPTQFAQWYRDTPGINQAFTVTLALTETSPGRYTYDSAAFFPLDNMGYGNSGSPTTG